MNNIKDHAPPQSAQIEPLVAFFRRMLEQACESGRCKFTIAFEVEFDKEGEHFDVPEAKP